MVSFEIIFIFSYNLNDILNTNSLCAMSTFEISFIYSFMLNIIKELVVHLYS